MSRPVHRRGRRLGATALAFVCGFCFIGAPVLAQENPLVGESTTTAVAPTTSGQTTTTGMATSTTTTLGPGSDGQPQELPSTIPPSVEDDPLVEIGEDISTGNYGGQGPFDISTRAVLLAELAAARAELEGIAVQLSESTERKQELANTISIIRERIATLGTESKLKVDAAVEARELMLARATEAYVRGDTQISLLSVIDDPLSYSSGKSYLEALAAGDHRAMLEYRAAASALDEEEEAIAAELVPLVEELVAVEDDTSSLIELRDGAEFKVRAYEAGTHVFVPGMVFPIVGDVHFIDSWGFPRLPGTGRSHWHEGIDIMAPTGRELVAVEDGIVERIGTAGLGGARLWLRGDSGNDYYYAHLSGYADGLSDGKRVDAGELIAYVGDTGGAAGGPAHLHFQIHPGGEDERPVNPFPILSVAYGSRPNLSQADALAGPRLGLPVELLGSARRMFGQVDPVSDGEE